MKRTTKTKKFVMPERSGTKFLVHLSSKARSPIKTFWDDEKAERQIKKTEWKVKSENVVSAF